MGAAILEQQEQLAYKESFPTTPILLDVAERIVIDPLLILTGEVEGCQNNYLLKV